MQTDILNQSEAQLGSLMTAWVQFVGEMVGPENVQFVTIAFIALLGISVLGMVLKMVKHVVTAFLLAIGIVVVASSLGWTSYVQLTPEVVEQVIEQGQSALDTMK